jgi:peroxiredoxin
MLKLHEPAPDFTLYYTSKQPVTLSSHRGQTVLLLFFPAAFTSVCTRELCEVNNDLAWYNQLQTIVYGISTDMLFSLARFKGEQQLNFELLSDYNRQVIYLYDCAYENFVYGMKGVAKRSAFVINRQGNLSYIEVLDDASQIPDFEKIKAAVSNS